MLYDKIELEPSESVRKVVRKHWFIITVELLGTLALIIVPLFLLLILNLAPEFFPITINFSSYYLIITFALCFWALLITLLSFTIWTNYFLDLWVITDRRIITIDQVGFFNRKVSSFRLERLQDIKVSIVGVIPTFLNFGTLKAQTASAAESNFVSTGLPDPRELQSMIQKAMDARLQSLNGVDAV